MNLTKRIMAIVLVMVFALALTACKKEESIEGNWKLTGGTFVTDTLGVPEGESLDDYFITVTFNFSNDGKFNMELSVMGVAEVVEGNYEIKDGKITMTPTDGTEGDPEIVEYKLEGDTLSFTGESSFGGMVLTRQK